MEGIDQQEFIIKFIEEAEDHVKGLNQGLLKLEADPHNREIIDELFRLAHTMKGAAKMVGLLKIADLAHKVEDVFGKVREEGRQLTHSEIDLLFGSFDTFKELLDEAVGKKESKEGVDIKEFCVLLNEMTEDKKTSAKKKSKIERTRKEPKTIIPTAKTTGKESKPKVVGRRLEDKEETIRVRTEKLDILSDLVSEIIMGQRQVEQNLWEVKELYLQAKEGLRLESSFRKKIQDLQTTVAKKEQLLEDMDNIEFIYTHLRNSLHKLFKKSVDSLSQLAMKTKDMQQKLLETRMLPLSVILDDLPRAVRDLAKQFGKEICIRISGGNTELDKNMLENLRDPIIHMIRNAVDHGIEFPEEREKLGKDRSGMIEISSWNEGDRIILEIKDNGRGIDWKKIKRVAAKKGYISPEFTRHLSDGDAVSLLFLPGFSTSSTTTDISGRGVGLDIVKKNIEELKGNISISTSRGWGTTVRLEMPLTLVMQRVLLVKVATETMAIPTVSVQGIIKINWADVRTIERNQALMIKGVTIPLMYLNQILGWKASPTGGKTEAIAVLVQWLDQRVAFLVDKVIGEQEVIVKNLGRHLRRIRNVAGVTILGNGEVVAILHIADLIDSIRGRSSEPPAIKKESKIKESQYSILVVEDSMTTREMEKSILEASDYSVETAADGIEAMEEAGKKRYDLFVIDIQMPRMDGFQLTEYLRSDRYYKDTPIIIVTSKEKEEDKIRGIELGVNAYITKKYFNQNVLLETVDHLIGEKKSQKEKVIIGK